MFRASDGKILQMLRDLGARLFQSRRVFDSVGARMGGVILGSVAPVSVLGGVLVWQDYVHLSEASLRRGEAVRLTADRRLRHDIDRTTAMLETTGEFDADGDRTMRFLSLAQSASGMKYCFLAELDQAGSVVNQVTSTVASGGGCEGVGGRPTGDKTFAEVVTSGKRAYARVVAPIAGGGGGFPTRVRFLVAVEPLDQAVSLAGPLDSTGGDVFADAAAWYVAPGGELSPLCAQCAWSRPPAGVVASLTSEAQETKSETASLITTYSSYTYGPVAGVGAILVATTRLPREAHSLWMLGLWILTIFGLLVTGLIGVMVAAHRLVVSPLRQLTQDVKMWDQSGRFEPVNARSTPVEFRTLSNVFRRATGRLARREAELERSIARQNLLIREIHHRVKNNLQIVASLLNLQGARIRAADMKEEFMLARDRVRTLATLHRHLYVEGEVESLNMGRFLAELGPQLMEAAGEEARAFITLQVEASDIVFPSNLATPMALIVSETVSNSLKYAFPDLRSGTILISLTQTGDEVILVVADDGIGLSASQGINDREGIGLQLIRGFARQMGAVLQIDEGAGTRYTVRTTLSARRAEAG
ncbi:sensor histidine kinase [Acetobacter sp. DsW_063]|uniref:sensor histidine kinase n=1 Tax=Acetobacter sp. DsW_063 TaxID=1514894 RepID=UPI000A396C77|nr:sensor histidine kinase [Acetobacter sp. DsW_063]